MEIKLQFLKKGKCPLCHEEENLYKIKFRKKRGVCETCFLGYLETKYPDTLITSRESGQDIIVRVDKGGGKS